MNVINVIKNIATTAYDGLGVLSNIVSGAYGNLAVMTNDCGAPRAKEALRKSHFIKGEHDLTLREMAVKVQAQCKHQKQHEQLIQTLLKREDLLNQRDIDQNHPKICEDRCEKSNCNTDQVLTRADLENYLNKELMEWGRYAFKHSREYRNATKTVQGLKVAYQAYKKREDDESCAMQCVMDNCI